MADLRTIAALVAVSMAVSGCGLDALEGKKSDFQIEQERRSALAMPVVDVPAAAPVVEPEPPKPECVPRWRVLDCDENGNEVWL